MRVSIIAILLQINLASCASYEPALPENIRQQCSYTSIDQVFSDPINAHGGLFCGNVFFRDAGGVYTFSDTLEASRVL